MDRMKWLAGIIGGCIGSELENAGQAAAEIRIRGGKRALLRRIDGSVVYGESISHEKLQEILQKLTENSFYVHEGDMVEGYFAIPGGFRAGVCGKLALRDGQPAQMVNVSSVCIRIPHAVPGCADELVAAAKSNMPCSLLVASPPGMGKTTLLRDFVRQLSDSGVQCAIVDERRELAACVEGVPQLDVGMNTDVMEGCPKAAALVSLIRSCAPQLIVLDEIGSRQDAEAIRDAARCGVCVAASVHARSLEGLMQRAYIAPLIRDGIFDYLVLLGNRPGQILEIRKYKKEDGD